MFVDEKVNWSTHTQILCKRLTSKEAAMKRLMRSASEDVPKATYDASSNSDAAYGIVV